MSARVTSVDVAQRAGVSQSTVSLVLSGKSRGRVSAGTEAQVRRAARDLGYRPNAAARALRTGATGTVGLVVPDATHPIFGIVQRGAQRAAWSAGYTVALVDTAHDPQWEAGSVRALQAAQADGFLLFEGAPPRTGRRATPEPIVAIEAEPRGVPSVRLDWESGTDAVMAHLLQLGHRRIGHLHSAVEAPTFTVRAERFSAALTAAGLDPAGQPRVASHFDLDASRRAGAELLATRPRPTAVFCDDDVLAAGLYVAAREAGLRVPDDVSIAGFDDLDVARILDPALTTVAVDAEALGATAFGALAELMAGRPAPRRQVLPVRLVVRASTGRPPRGR